MPQTRESKTKRTPFWDNLRGFDLILDDISDGVSMQFGMAYANVDLVNTNPISCLLLSCTLIAQQA